MQVQWYYVQSHYCAAIATTEFLYVFGILC